VKENQEKDCVHVQVEAGLMNDNVSDHPQLEDTPSISI
tara:strand:+ start:299 stop:412 length:114 start_codon:yes stop_codon:yes gene_type:complete